MPNDSGADIQGMHAFAAELLIAINAHVIKTIQAGVVKTAARPVTGPSADSMF